MIGAVVVGGHVDPLWLPPLLVVGIVVWTFVWVLAIRWVFLIGLPSRADMLAGLSVPPWKSVLSFAIGLPMVLAAMLGFLGIGALLVASVGSILFGGAQ